jgi:hypothetical protein
MSPEMITGGAPDAAGGPGFQPPAYFQNGAAALPYDARKVSGHVLE